MSDIRFLESQVAQLHRLLEKAGDDPILRPQLEKRLSAAKRKLEDALNVPGELLPRVSAPAPRVALFLGGAEVDGSDGIRPSLAAHTLVNYERLFTAQALHEERMVAESQGRKRRARGTPMPGLWLTATPRGSFGLEFTIPTNEDGGTNKLHEAAIRTVSSALAQIRPDKALDVVLESLAPKAIVALRRFFADLASHHATLRVQTWFGETAKISADLVQETAERLLSEISEDRIDRIGIFRGLTRESYRFDLLTDEGLIEGVISEKLEEDDLERISRLTNKPCVASLVRTTFKNADSKRSRYELLDAKEIPG